MSFHAAAVVQAPVFAVSFYTENGLVYGANSSYENVAFPDLKPGDGRVVLQFPQFHLPTDTYYISVLIAEKNPCDLLDCRHFAYTLVVDRAPDARGGLKLPVSWRMEGV